MERHLNASRRAARAAARAAMTESPPIVLVFAASDPTSGAGLQADLLALAAHGCHAVTVVTALTVQDTHGVRQVLPVDAEFVARQADALLDELPVAAFKLGALATRANVLAVARRLARFPASAVVFDPVLASGRGDALADEGAIAAMREELLPLTSILTPNSIELRHLAVADDRTTLADCAHRLTQLGAKHVLVTGTHEPTREVQNTLYDGRGVVRSDSWPRLAGSYHGSGCTLASALAAQLAIGMPVSAAARAAQAYTWRTLRGAFRPGSGQHIPDRLPDLRVERP
jgi:hydroxymethylpyrimidine/phosphomethylpyrimidine kinase